MTLLTLTLAAAASFGPATAARFVGEQVVAWDGDRGLTAYDPLTGATRWVTPLPARPYGWQPLGAVGDTIVVDSTPPVLVTRTGTFVAPPDWGERARCAVEERGGAVLLVCMDHAVVLEPGRLEPVGAGLRHGETCLPARDPVPDRDGERFCGYHGPGSRPVGRVAARTLVLGEDARAAPPSGDAPFVLTAFADDGSREWTLPADPAGEAGVHGDLAWLRTGAALVAIAAADGQPRWSATLPGARRAHATAAGLAVTTPGATTLLDWRDGHVVWHLPLAEGERVVFGEEVATADPVSGEPSLPLVTGGPALVRVIDPATGTERGRFTVADGTSTFAMPGGYVTLTPGGTLTLRDAAGARLTTLRLGGESAYFTLAADDTRLVVTRFAETVVVDRTTGRVRWRLSGQYHPVVLLGDHVVLHRRPLGDAGDLQLRD